MRSRDVIPGTDVTARQPLPEFIPSTLFSDLALPEVEVTPPSITTRQPTRFCPLGWS